MTEGGEMAGADVPIEDVLDDLVPDWREVAKRMSGEGSSDADITAELQRRIRAGIDPLLDLYNALDKGGRG